jgi:hypothetical protein
MDEDVLAGITWKLWRAHQHLDALHEAVKGFFQTDFYRTVREQDRKGRLVERVIEVDPMPPVWGVLVSDLAHQLRSTLDHLLVAVARPNAGEESKLQFPICSTREAWRNAQWRMPGTTRDIRRAIDEVQPYHRRKWPDTLLLAQLREISNWDKHHTLLASAAFTEVQNLAVSARGGTSVRSTQTFRGRIEPGAVLTRVEVGPSRVGAEVHTKRDIGFLDVFEKGCPREVRGKPIRTTLANIGDFVEGQILPRFERLA